MAPFLTYLYEVAGRRLTITYALFSLVLLVMLMPIVAPSFAMLCLLRGVIGISTSLLCSAPLISDYIKKESRGKAVAQNLIAAVLA